jgi:hypothetical protein
MPAAWWLALVLLVLNDHVLKGSGLLPGWLTGKLSDFAGLIVAPILGCAALSLRSDRPRAWIFFAVSLAFAAIKLSEPCAVAAASVLTALGVPSRIWCDPTDLVAFSVLPWTAQLARSMPPPEARAGLQMRHRAALALAACACIATSDESYTLDQSAPYLINWTRVPVTLEVDKRFFGCGADASAEDAPLLQGSVTVQPGKVAAIGWVPEYYEDAGIKDCGEATIRAGAETVRIEWRPDRGEHNTIWFKNGDHTASNFPIGTDDQWVFDLGVTVTGAIEAPQLEVGSALRPAP